MVVVGCCLLFVVCCCCVWFVVSFWLCVLQCFLCCVFVPLSLVFKPSMIGFVVCNVLFWWVGGGSGLCVV